MLTVLVNLNSSARTPLHVLRTRRHPYPQSQCDVTHQKRTFKKKKLQLNPPSLSNHPFQYLQSLVPSADHLVTLQPRNALYEIIL